METKTTTRIINLHHLLWEFLIQISKWWWLILLITAMATLAGAGYATMKNKSEAGGGITEEVQGETVTAGITEIEFAHVYNAANIYDKIQQQKDIIENSRWFLYDDMKKIVLTAVCYIDMNGAENLENRPVWICLNQFEGDELYNAAAQAIGEETKAQFLRENIGYGYKDTNNFYIQITSYDRESAERIETAVLEYLREQMKTMKEEIQAECSIEVLSQECIDYVDMAIGDNKANLRNTLASLQTALNDTLAGMTNIEKGYYTEYLTAREKDGYVPGQELTFFVEAEIDPEILAEQAANAEKVELTPEELAAKRLRTDTFLGFILGLCLSLGAILVKYCWSSKLMNGEELNRMYGIAMLGTVTETERKQRRLEKIMRRRQRRLAQEKDKQQIASEATARLRLQFDEKDKIYISGTQAQEEIETLIEAGEKQGITFVSGKNILEFSPELAEVNHAAAVLLVEKERVSNYRDIDKEIQVLREAGKKICGAIILS